MYRMSPPQVSPKGGGDANGGVAGRTLDYQRVPRCEAVTTCRMVQHERRRGQDGYFIWTSQCARSRAA